MYVLTRGPDHVPSADAQGLHGAVGDRSAILRGAVARRDSEGWLERSSPDAAVLPAVLASLAFSPARFQAWRGILVCTLRPDALPEGCGLEQHLRFDKGNLRAGYDTIPCADRCFGLKGD